MHCLTHVPFEDAANIGEWTKLHGHSLTYTHLYREDTLPAIESFDILAIMGGPMNVDEHDQYPWLTSEKDFIRQTIDAEKKVVGICLGAQLIAAVLGGQVIPNPQKEIGWYLVQRTPQAAQLGAFAALSDRMMVFHWHGDTFSLPPGAVKLASSVVCENQAFQYAPMCWACSFIWSIRSTVLKRCWQIVSMNLSTHPVSKPKMKSEVVSPTSRKMLSGYIPC